MSEKLHLRKMGSAEPAVDDVSLTQPANDHIRKTLDSFVFDDTQPFYVASTDGELLHFNDAYCRLHGDQASEALLPGAPAAERAMTTRHAGVLRDVLMSGRAVNTDETMSTGGRTAHFRGRHFPVRDESGRIVAVGGYYTDVTTEMLSRREAIRARRRFSDFARATSDWFWETDRDGKLKYLSDRFSACIGQPAALFYDRKIRDLATPDCEPSMLTRIERTFEERTAFRNMPIEIESGDGTIRRCHLSGVPVFEPSDGSFLGYRGAGMDVTESHRDAERSLIAQRNLEETLEELTRKNLELDIATAQAQSALHAKNDFLAAMSHELRTPLNAIIGFAEAMEMQVFGKLDEKYVQYSHDITHAGRHLLNLINDVLDVAVLESDRIKLSLRQISLRDLMEEAVSLNRMRAESRNLDLSGINVTEDVTVMADMRRAKQILVNLLSNAVKFTPEGGKVGADVTVRDGCAHITIWDTGYGIAPEDQESVFEKFNQGPEHIYSRSNEGTGLGLHISRELARQMNGDIYLESVPEKGSRFTLVLPLAGNAPANE